jgi:ankyrin repeat protein
MLLTQSASNGNFNSVKRLLSTGCNVDLRADDGSTALHCAARTGQTAVLQMLISYGADLNVENHRGWNPLFDAVVGGHLDCISLLLEAGTNLPRLYFDYSPFFHLAARTGNLDIVKAILAAASETNRRKILLSLATSCVEFGHVALLQYLHKLEGTIVEIQSRKIHRQSRQPWLLHGAVHNGHLATVEYLLPLYGISEELFYLLRMAAKQGRADICKVLLAHNPAVERDFSLYLAAQNGHLPVIIVLLEHQDISLAKKKLDLRIPILAALWNDRLDSLRYLVSYHHGIPQPFQEQSDGLSRVELVRCLIHSKKLRININSLAKNHLAKWWQDGTLLHLAAEHNDLELAEYVLQHDFFEHSNLGKQLSWIASECGDKVTALDTAQNEGSTEVANLLIAHGATNRNLVPDAPYQTGRDSPSRDSVSDLEMQEISDYESGSDIEPLQAQEYLQDISDTSKTKLSINFILQA